MDCDAPKCAHERAPSADMHDVVDLVASDDEEMAKHVDAGEEGVMHEDEAEDSDDEWTQDPEISKILGPEWYGQCVFARSLSCHVGSRL